VSALARERQRCGQEGGVQDHRLSRPGHETVRRGESPAPCP
jgi:hypothetical protein